MALYSPPSRNYPQELPDYWRFEDGTVRTDLQTLTNTQLKALGWHGPITMPQDIEGTSFYTHNYTWNSETVSFDVEEVSQYEKQRRVDYRGFWNGLINGSGAYQKIKDSAKTSLEVNTVVTEFIALITDAKSGNANVEKIQAALTEILSVVTFTASELTEIQNLFVSSGMFAVYTLS
jgi:hypothetical protein